MATRQRPKGLWLFLGGLAVVAALLIALGVDLSTEAQRRSIDQDVQQSRENLDETGNNIDILLNGRPTPTTAAP